MNLFDKKAISAEIKKRLPLEYHECITDIHIDQVQQYMNQDGDFDVHSFTTPGEREILWYGERASFAGDDTYERQHPGKKCVVVKRKKFVWRLWNRLTQ